jgi:hypothetical protein
MNRRLTKRWSERPLVLRSPFAWLKPFRFERRSPPVAVAQLVLFPGRRKRP